MPDRSLNGQLCRLVHELVEHGIPLHQALKQFERQYLLAAVDKNDGNLTRSAETLGIHRNTLRNKMSSLEITAGTAARPRR